MKKLIFLLSLIALVASTAFSQNVNNMEAELLLGFEKHDKRFYLDSSDSNQEWGTRYFGLRMNKRLYHNQFVSIQGGLGYAREVNTFSTPYD